jgi:WD40 repeat protein
MRVQWSTASADLRLRTSFPAGRPSVVTPAVVDGVPVYLTATTPHYDGDCTRPEPHDCYERALRMWTQTGETLLTVDRIGDDPLIVMDIDGSPTVVTFEQNHDRSPDEPADLLAVDLRTGGITRVPGHPAKALGIHAASAHSIVSMGWDGCMREFDLRTGAVSVRDTGQRLGVLGVLRPQGAPVIVATGDGLLLWDLETGTAIGELAEATRVHQIATWPGDDTLIATVSFGGPIAVWDLATRTQVGTELNLGRYAYSVACLSTVDGRRLVAGSDSEAVRLWDPFSGEEVGPPLLGPTAFCTVTAGPPGTVLTASATDDRVGVWELAADAGPARLGHPSMITCLTAGTDGFAVAGGRDGSIGRFDLSQGQHEPLGTITAPARTVAVSSVGSDTVILAGGGDLNGAPDNDVHRWVNGRVAPSLTAAHNGHVELVVPDTVDGQPVVFCSGVANSAYMLDADSGELLGAFEGRSPVISLASATVDGHKLVAVSFYVKHLLLGDLDAGAAVPAPDIEIGEAVRAIVTIAGQPALVTERSGEARVRFVHTGECGVLQPERTAHISAFAVRGGEVPLVAVGRTDASVSVIDLASRQTVAAINLPYWCTALAWTADGDLLAACRRDLMRLSL